MCLQERKDFLQGLCLFVKLTKDYQGLFLIISKSDLDERKLKLLGLGEKKEVRKKADDGYDGIEERRCSNDRVGMGCLYTFCVPGVLRRLLFASLSVRR